MNQRRAEPSDTVDDAIRTRRSIRRFLPTPVAEETVRELLALAARAPSGTNVQPWRAYVLAGQEKDTLAQAVVAKYRSSGEESKDFEYYPREWLEPWISRRRKVGADLYGLLEITKGDKEKMLAQWTRNYLFFDAPVGLIFTIDRVFGPGMLLDYGMFMENLMLAARARGLDTCPQAAFADFPETIATTLGLPENERVICGMSLGYADPAAPENTLHTERAAVETFADFRGFPV